MESSSVNSNVASRNYLRVFPRNAKRLS